MSTILEERSQTEFREEVEIGKIESPADERADHEKSNSNRVVDSKFELILPVDEAGIDQKSLDFAIQTVRNFSGRLVLLYVAERTNIPSGFTEFAHAERIRDYEWHYYNALANDRIGSIAKEAEAAGIEWVGHVHLGGISSAVRHYNRKRGLVMLSQSVRSGKVAKYLRRLSIGEIAKLGVPLLII